MVVKMVVKVADSTCADTGLPMPIRPSPSVAAQESHDHRHLPCIRRQGQTQSPEFRS
jgi:hypothetical protein